MPAGSSRVERLDPFALPLRFEDADHAADERVRVVELHREHVVLRRALCGIKMAVNLPVAAYLGVAIRMEPTTAHSPGAIAVVLEHPDPALSLTLCRAADGSDIVAEWQSWGRALGMPLLVEESDGRLREPFERIGGVRVGIPVSRRRRRSSLHARRASMPLRRGHGSLPRSPNVHCGEREIIARN
jgi:uncharacterized protein DUF6101